MNFIIWPVESQQDLDDLIDSSDLRKIQTGETYSGDSYIDAFYMYVGCQFTAAINLPRYICIMDANTYYLNYVILGSMDAKISAFMLSDDYKSEIVLN